MSFDLSNHHRIAVQKYAQQLLGNKYPKYAELLLRLSTALAVPKDLTDFTQMIADAYQTGYLKAVEDYRKAVEAHGFKVEIKSEK